MNESQNSNPPETSRIFRRLGKILLFIFLILFLFLFLAAGVGTGEIEAFIALAFGWLQFLKRTIPQISWSWDLAGMAILSSAIILVLAHQFFGWITDNIAKSRGQNYKWLWKWTWCGLVTIALLFLVGMSLGGAAHQIGWIAGSKEPWLERKGKWFTEYNNMRQLELAFRMAIQDENDNLEKGRKALWKSPNEYFNQSQSLPPLMQAYHLLVVTKDDGAVDGVIIFPRNTEALKAAGAYCSIGEKEYGPIPAKDLDALLQKYRKHLTAL